MPEPSDDETRMLEFVASRWRGRDADHRGESGAGSDTNPKIVMNDRCGVTHHVELRMLRAQLSRFL